MTLCFGGASMPVGAAPEAPIIANEDSVSNDQSPVLLLNLPTAPVAGDVLKIKDGGVLNYSVELSQAMIYAGEYTNFPVPLSEAVHTLTVTHTRITESPPSNIYTHEVDLTAPLLQSTSPADNATGIDTRASLTATFDLPIQFGTGTIRLYDADDDLIESFNVATEVGTGSGFVSISGAVLTINPFASMEGSKAHYVQIDSTAIQSTLGNAYAGIANKTSWNFTTAAHVPAVWNSADKAASIVLSGSDLVATGGGTNDANVRAIIGSSTDKKYYEFTLTATTASGFQGIGAASATANLNGNMSVSAQGVCWLHEYGTLFYNGGNLLNNAAYILAAGDVGCVAIDTAAKLIWIRKGAGNWNNSATANPATGVEGYSILGMTGLIHPAANPRSASTSYTVNFGASAYAHTAPSGFGNW